MTRVIMSDTTGIAEAMLFDRVHVRHDSEKVSERAKQEFFAIGVGDEARASGRKKLERTLAGREFSDPKVIDEIAAARTELTRQEGLALVAERTAELIKDSGYRGSYVDRVNAEIDKRIAALQGEALGLVKDQLASPDYLTLLTQTRDQLKAPYEEMRANCGQKFDQDIETAMNHLKEGKLGKAYSMLRILGYAMRNEIGEGVKIVQKNHAPEWLIDEMIKELVVNHGPLARIEASVWYRNPDRSVAILAQKDGVTCIKEYRLPEQESIKKTCIDTLTELEYPLSFQGGYLPIDQPMEYLDGGKKKLKPSPLQRLAEDAMKREHRD